MKITIIENGVVKQVYAVISDCSVCIKPDDENVPDTISNAANPLAYYLCRSCGKAKAPRDGGMCYSCAEFNAAGGK